MLTTNIAEMTAKIDAHRAADLLVQGTYFDDDTGKGCFIGCLAHGNRPSLIADTYGIPEMLTRVLESIFERLGAADAAEFFTAIPRAIGKDGKDLSRVVWAFLASELRALPPTKEIEAVIAGMDLKAAGLNWPDAARAADAAARAARAGAAARAARADAATGAAAYAADAAAYAAGAAAYAAAYAAYAAAGAAAGAAAYSDAYAAVTIRQRDLILQLMESAQ